MNRLDQHRLEANVELFVDGIDALADLPDTLVELRDARTPLWMGPVHSKRERAHAWSDR